ncbi:MAG: hypothetical protein RL565_812, partial [Pseudomonadota bacterium]
NKIGIATVATTGASSHDSLDFAPLAGKRVYLWPDFDEAGKKHMEAVRSLLNGLGCTTHLIEIDALELPPKGDAFDWLKTHHVGIFNKPSVEVLKAAKDAVLGLPLVAEILTNIDIQKEAKPETGSIESQKESIDEIISRLSKLRPIEYEIAKKAELEKLKELGVTGKGLDQEVRLKQKERDEAKTMPFKVFEPWPNPVNGAEILDAVSKTIHRYVFCNRDTATVATLWIAHTYLMDCIRFSPLAIITAPEKGCGKSTLLGVMASMVNKPMPTSALSSAVLYRMVDKHHPTLLIDEVDTFIAEDEAMRGIINSGHRRDLAIVYKCSGDNHDVTPFSSWSAKLLCGISAKNLHETLVSRSVLLELRKKLPSETIASNRNNEAEYEAISRKLLRWTGDIAKDMSKAVPTFPDGLGDRAKDNWEVLLNIASLAGGQWPELARSAAQSLNAHPENKGIKTELLEDIKSVFETRKIDRISTHDLITDLCIDDEAPWATSDKGRNINARQLNGLLKGYGIASKTIRFGGYETAKGFEKSQFEDAWSRYLGDARANPPENAVTSVTPSQANSYKALNVTDSNSLAVTENSLSVTNTPCDGTKNLAVTVKPLQYMACDGIDPKSGVSSAHTSNLTKDELDASWDRLINEPDVRTAL